MTLIDDLCDGCGSRFDPMGDPHLTKHPEIGPYAVFCARCEHDTTTTPVNQGGSAMNTNPSKPIGFRKSQPWQGVPDAIGWRFWVGPLLVVRTPGLRPGITVGWVR